MHSLVCVIVDLAVEHLFYCIEISRDLHVIYVVTGNAKILATNKTSEGQLRFSYHQCIVVYNVSNVASFTANYKTIIYVSVPFCV